MYISNPNFAATMTFRVSRDFRKSSGKFLIGFLLLLYKNFCGPTYMYESPFLLNIFITIFIVFLFYILFFEKIRNYTYYFDIQIQVVYFCRH